MEKSFNKKFKLLVDKDIKNINFKLLNSGINAEINFDNNSNKKTTKGTFKSKILNTNLKLNFELDENELKVFKSYFRSKNLSFNNNSN